MSFETYYFSPLYFRIKVTVTPLLGAAATVGGHDLGPPDQDLAPVPVLHVLVPAHQKDDQGIVFK